jgi:UDP-N-acetylmuramate-alanine ligase
MKSVYDESGIGGGGMGTLYAYLLNTDGSKVKGSDVIEERHYEYTVE